LVEGAYTFEVSSAGAERALKRPSDFERFVGSTVEVKLYKSRNGIKEYVGILSGYQEGHISLLVGNNELSFEQNETAHVRLRITF